MLYRLSPKTHGEYGIAWKMPALYHTLQKLRIKKNLVHMSEVSICNQLCFTCGKVINSIMIPIWITLSDIALTVMICIISSRAVGEPQKDALVFS